MEARDRYRESLAKSNLQAKELLRYAVALRKSKRDVGLLSALLRVFLLVPLALFLLLMNRLQRLLVGL